MSKKSKRKRQADSRWPAFGSDEERVLQDRILVYWSGTGKSPHAQPSQSDDDPEIAALSAEFDDLLQKPKWRDHIPTSQLRLMVFYLLVRCSAERRTESFPAVTEIYSQAAKRLPPRERRAMIERFASAVPAFDLDPYLAFATFVYGEKDLSLGITGAFWTAIQETDPDATNDAGPTLVGRAAFMADHVAAGVWARGLLLLGDQRYLDLLDGIWDVASLDGLEALTMAMPGQQYVASAEFYLRFLEAIPREGFFSPCAGLANMATAGGSRYPEFLDVARDLPQTPQNAEERTHILRTLTKFELAKEIEPRLQMALHNEGDYRPLPFRDDGVRSVARALAAWGLPWKPNSPEEETLLRRSLKNT